MKHFNHLIIQKAKDKIWYNTEFCVNKICNLNSFVHIRRLSIASCFTAFYLYHFSGQTLQDPSELQQFVKKDYETNKYYCTLCERFSHKSTTHIRNHVESQHFPNTFSYPCDICGEVLTSKSNFMLHRSRKHLNNKQK